MPNAFYSLLGGQGSGEKGVCICCDVLQCCKMRRKTHLFTFVCSSFLLLFSMHVLSMEVVPFLYTEIYKSDEIEDTLLEKCKNLHDKSRSIVVTSCSEMPMRSSPCRTTLCA
jgi:hypothetical protein